MTETHAVRISDGRIVEHVVGDNPFHMPCQELVAWQVPFPEPRRTRPQAPGRVGHRPGEPSRQ